jgi:hypothetical protein
MALTKCKTGFWLVFLLLAMILMPISWAGATAPYSEEMIPIFPGSWDDPEAETQWEEQHGFGGVFIWVEGVQLPLEAESHAFYTVDAPLEEVAKYYVMELGAIESYDTDPNLTALAEGRSTPIYVEYTVYDWQFNDSYDYEGKLLRSGAKVREALRANRAPHSSGGWLSRVLFSWFYRDWDGSIILFEIACEDRSFDQDYSEFQGTKTLIEVHRYTYMSEEAAWEMEEEAMDLEVAELAAQMALSPPTEESLGIPIYPGSEFQPDISAGISFGGTPLYVFFALETPEEIVKWYEKETGMKSESWDVDCYYIPISGQMPFPDKGVTVQPNLAFGGPWKSMITLVGAEGYYDGSSEW